MVSSHFHLHNKHTISSAWKRLLVKYIRWVESWGQRLFPAQRAGLVRRVRNKIVCEHFLFILGTKPTYIKHVKKWQVY